MAGPEVMTSPPEAPSRPGRTARASVAGTLRRLNSRTPLRTKLITAVLGLVIMAIAAISIASVYMLRGYVTTQKDPTLTQLYPHVTTVLPPGNATVLQNAPGYIVIVQKPGGQATWYTSNSQTGVGGQGSQRSLPSLPSLPTGANWAGGPNPLLLTVPSKSGPDTWRVIATTYTNDSYTDANGVPETGTFTIVLATDLGNINALTTRLILFDIIVGAALVVVLAAVGVAVVQTNLRPLNDIEMTAGQIALGHLNHRVPEGDPRTEIGSLGRSLNVMLSQVETAFHAREASEQAAHESEERMRRFIADASHELRTPLTTIRGFAAHYRQRGGANGSLTGVPAAANSRSFRTGAASPGRPDYSPGGGDGLTPEDLNHLMGRVEAEATRMGLLVEDLLTLARLDQQRPLAKAPVDLLTLAADAVQDARIVSPGRPIDLVVAPGTAFLVDGDEPRLRQVLSNLVNNALTHTPDGTPVRVKIGRGTLPAGLAPAGGATVPDGEPGGEPGAWASAASPATSPGGVPAAGLAGPASTGQPVPAVVLDVEDDGPGMTPDQAQRVFERFYRADAARNRASGGTGLGLAIVAGLVAAHGGSVAVRTALGQGADFQVKLPLSPDALASDEADDELPA
jgi:two-component system, OmpR family, sensor kinase